MKRSEVQWSEMKWREVMILGEMCVLLLIYIYVVVCSFCAVRCELLFASICYILITRLTFFKYYFFVWFLAFCLFSVLCILCFFIVLCTVSPFVYSCFFPIFVLVYRSLPPGETPIAVNKYHTISYHIISYHIISYHIISYHIISYHIISYHIISYHITWYHIILSHISYHIIYHIIYHILYHIISYGYLPQRDGTRCRWAECSVSCLGKRCCTRTSRHRIPWCWSGWWIPSRTTSRATLGWCDPRTPPWAAVRPRKMRTRAFPTHRQLHCTWFMMSVGWAMNRLRQTGDLIHDGTTVVP
jgi:hypothetical protein